VAIKRLACPSMQGQTYAARVECSMNAVLGDGFIKLDGTRRSRLTLCPGLRRYG
jgi:hypothetical protein